MGNLDIKTYKLYQEISAGGVAILSRAGKEHVLIIERERMNDCCLPKGHQKEGESLQETAEREVEEETGYKAEPAAYLGACTYQVKSEAPKQIVLKTVHWFLMKVQGGKGRESNEEIRKVRRVPLEDDFSFLTYENERLLIKRAKRVLSKRCVT